MDYDNLIKQHTIDSIPREQVEQAIAKALHAYMNEGAENAHRLYENVLRERCRERGLVYMQNGREVLRFPVEWFTSNIKTNKLDAGKWKSTLQDKFLQYMNRGVKGEVKEKSDDVSKDKQRQEASPEKEREIINHLRAVDHRINESFHSENDCPKEIAPLIFIGIGTVVMVETFVANAAILGLAGYFLSQKIQDDLKKAPPIPSRGGTVTGGGNRTGSDGGNPPDPPPPPPSIPDTNDRQDSKRGDRLRRRGRTDGKELQRRNRKDYYFGYVDRVQEFKNGFEIRLEAIADNSLCDEIFIREVQKLFVVAGAPSFGLYRLALIHIYVHKVPTGIEGGKWINFKVDMKGATPVTRSNSPDLSGSFRDGITILEPLIPRISFVKRRMECFFANDDGSIVQTELDTISKDFSATILQTLDTAFGEFDSVIQSMKGVLNRVINPNTDTEAKPKPFYDPSNAGDIENVLLHKGDHAIKYSMYNVGQGKSLPWLLKRF